MRDNIVTAAYNDDGRCQTRMLYQYDYGQKLVITGIDLPTAYEVHFGNTVHGEATTQIGTADGVPIPDMYLLNGKPVYAWLYLHSGEDDGETEFVITIPVGVRARPSDTPPTPVQQSVIEEAIVVLNNAVEQTGEAVTAASGYADAAEASADAAAESAEHAEQAAQIAGYMSFRTDEHGHVIYQRTDTVDIDFELENGRLVAIWQ